MPYGDSRIGQVTERRPDILDRLAAARMGPVGLLLRRLLSTEQGRYLVVAGTVSLGYLGLVAIGLAAGLPYMLAIALAQAVTIACAFPAYRTLVFRSSGPMGSEFRRFLSVWSGCLVVTFGATPLLVELASTPPFLAQVVLVAVVPVGSFLGHRFFGFRHRHRPPADAV
jgi:putative flippase GtrA